ncbi:EF-hand [Linderina pennispora]|uniref:EF-hand n=1 Tax=Linderina pennispora TaxID=61395 RepID=A0A1Y1WHN7_9FUNG|nr:EF-hand [Linderina pennispora]ORX72885.1 EF-hand [Linderina pennispora]
MSYGYRGGPPPQQQQQQQGNYGRPPPPQQGGGYGGGYGGGQQGGYGGQQGGYGNDGSGQLDANELQQALVNGDWSRFSLDTVRLMIAMFDRDHSGTISFDEFVGLWRYIEEWKQCFRTFDRDNSGTIDRGELLQALNAFGFRVSPQIVDMLIRKYDIQGKLSHAAVEHTNNRRGAITFDNFINSCVTIRSLTDSFRRYDTDNDGWVNMNYETYFENIVRFM